MNDAWHVLDFVLPDDRARLVAFLNQHAATMPRTTLRTAIEHFDKDERQRYLTR
jgi:hypothetical protein